jgi:hypothetical protein
MGAHRTAVDMMDKASALSTYPQRQQQKQPTDFTIGLKASTRLHDEGKKEYGQGLGVLAVGRASIETHQTRRPARSQSHVFFGVECVFCALVRVKTHSE